MTWLTHCPAWLARGHRQEERNHPNQVDECPFRLPSFAICEPCALPSVPLMRARKLSGPRALERLHQALHTNEKGIKPRHFLETVAHGGSRCAEGDHLGVDSCYRLIHSR